MNKVRRLFSRGVRVGREENEDRSMRLEESWRRGAKILPKRAAGSRAPNHQIAQGEDWAAGLFKEASQCHSRGLTNWGGGEAWRESPRGRAKLSHRLRQAKLPRLAHHRHVFVTFLSYWLWTIIASDEFSLSPFHTNIQTLGHPSRHVQPSAPELPTWKLSPSSYTRCSIESCLISLNYGSP